MRHTLNQDYFIHIQVLDIVEPHKIQQLFHKLEKEITELAPVEIQIFEGKKLTYISIQDKQVKKQLK